MRKLVLLAGAALLIPAASTAQQKPVLEIGTYAGMTFERVGTTGDKDTWTHLSIPELGLFGTFFPSNTLFVEPELAFVRDDVAGTTSTGFGLMTSVGWAFSGVSLNSLYLAPAAGITISDLSSDEFDSDSQTDWSAGLRGGYRVLVRNALALRFEAGWFRQFPEQGDDSNMFVLRVGIGGLLHSGSTRTAGR